MDDLIIPEDLTTLDDDALAALLAQAIEAFDALNGENVTAETLATMTMLAAAIDTLRTESQGRVDAAEAVAAEAAALAEQVHGNTSPAEQEVDEDGNPIEAPPAPEAEGGEPEGGTVIEPPVSVAAGGTPAPPRQRVVVPLGAIRDRAPAPALPEGNGPITIIAAADLPGVTAGQRIGLAEVAQGMHDRARSLQDNGNRSLVATIERPALPDAWHVGSESDQEATQAALDAVLGQFDDAASLVAAGGWCAPNTPIWQFFAVEGTDGLVDLPTVGVDRAGITWPVSPSIADVFSAPWLWTEQNDLDAVDPEGEDFTTKPCFRVPCPTWASARLDAHGICITHGNLSDRAFPENTRRYVSLVESAHEHLISSRLLTAMVAGSAAVPIAASAGAASAVLAAVDLQVADYRAKYRMADSAVLETVFPSWTTALFRSDIARRDGVDVFSVSDADVQAWFNARNTRAQFVQDWQTLGAPAAAVAWPATLKFMIYAAGTWARGNGGRIDLGVVRDSSLNATNDHTAAWSEEMLLLAKMGNESRVVTVPVCPNGTHGLATAIACPVA